MEKKDYLEIQPFKGTLVGRTAVMFDRAYKAKSVYIH